MTDIRKFAEERFWPRVTKGAGCWEWTGSVNEDGYGRFAVSHRKTVRAHRWAYEALVGPIPQGLVIDHLCRNRACVNPAHMEPVTNRTNVLRGDGITARFSRAEVCKFGHKFDGVREGRRVCLECRKRHKREWAAKTRKIGENE